MRAIYDNDLNFAAFALAILKPLTPEQAFDALELRIQPKHVKLSERDYEDILDMRGKGITWDDIRSMYGLSNGASIHHRVRRYKERRQKQC